MTTERVRVLACVCVNRIELQQLIVAFVCLTFSDVFIGC